MNLFQNQSLQDLDMWLLQLVSDLGTGSGYSRFNSPGLRQGETDADGVLIVNTYQQIDERVNYFKKLNAGFIVEVANRKRLPKKHTPQVVEAVVPTACRFP